DLWAGELDFVETIIVQDVRNNSAWHHRFFVVFQSGIREGADYDHLNFRFAKQNISFAANNPSAWHYLRGILDINDIPYSRVEDFVRLYADTSDDAIRDVVDLENPVAIEFLADIHEKEGRILQATELWKSLADEHDTIRKKIREGLKSVKQ
ncbi:hypothetical protein C0995_003655, partial [Termitomyces sp. Mi166